MEPRPWPVVTSTRNFPVVRYFSAAFRASSAVSQVQRSLQLREQALEGTAQVTIDLGEAPSVGSPSVDPGDMGTVHRPRVDVS